MHFDVELTLGRNLIEAATTGVTLHIDDTQSVARTLADALEGTEEARLDLDFQVLGTLLEHGLLLAGLRQDILQLALFLVKILLTLLALGLGYLQVVGTVSHLVRCLLDFLVAKFHLQTLVIDLLAQRVILAVVAHLIELVVVTLQVGLCLLHLTLLHRDSRLKLLDFCVDFLDTGVDLRSCPPGPAPPAATRHATHASRR